MDIQEAIAIASPAMFESFGGGSVCSFGGVGEKYHRPCHNHPCHYDAKSNWKKEIEYYYSTVAYSDGTQDDLEKIMGFAEWLISNDGPWKKLVGDRKKQVLTDGRKVGYLFEVKPDDEITWLCSLSIAGRVPQEKKNSWKLFKELLDNGVSYTDAFYICGYFNKDHYGKIATGGYAGGGHSIHPDLVYHKSRIFDFKRFSEGNPKVYGAKLVGGNAGYNINDSFTMNSKELFPALSEKVETVSAIKGRWTSVPAGKSVNGILKTWNNGYRKELLELCARAA